MSNDVLYHYCSSFAFREIIQSKKLWLSSMKFSNDYFEGSWISRVLDSKEVKRHFKSRAHHILKKYVDECYKNFSALALCLSGKGDLLSQWRGYADNGQGFCIGFSKAGLERSLSGRNIELCKVNYLPDYRVDREDTELVIEYLHDAYNWLTETQIYDYLDDQATLDVLNFASPTEVEQIDSRLDSMISIFSEVSNKLYLFKNNAFEEEDEWRLMEPIYYTGDLLYRSSRDKIIPYKEVDINTRGGIIKEVIIGPKNISDVVTIHDFVSQSGLKDERGLRVDRSSASYR